jgi:hypothetical protein
LDTEKALQPFGDIAMLDTQGLRDLIAEIERLSKEHGVLMELPIEHHFSKGVYAREMRMPKGVMVVGKIHKHQNLNILSAGEVSVLSVDGVKRVKAPYTFVASPGAKRVIYAHEDAVWTTIHGTDLKDVEKIEDEFIAKNYDEVVEIAAEHKLKLKGDLCRG